MSYHNQTIFHLSFFISFSCEQIVSGTCSLKLKWAFPMQMCEPVDPRWVASYKRRNAIGCHVFIGIVSHLLSGTKINACSSTLIRLIFLWKWCRRCNLRRGRGILGLENEDFYVIIMINGSMKVNKTRYVSSIYVYLKFIISWIYV